MADPAFVREDNVYFNGTMNKVAIVKEEDGIKTAVLWDKLSEGDKEMFTDFMEKKKGDTWPALVSAKALNGAPLIDLIPLKSYGKKPPVPLHCSHNEHVKYFDGKVWRFLDDDAEIPSKKEEKAVEAPKVEPKVVEEPKETVEIPPPPPPVVPSPIEPTPAPVEPPAEAVKVDSTPVQPAPTK